MQRFKPKFITCPRCGLKNLENATACDDCGLVFARLEMATNGDAKRKKLRGDRDFIIKVKKLPSDVSFLKLLLYAILLGVFGGHCYYVGRYLRGIMLTTNFVVMLILLIFNSFFLTVWNGAFYDIIMPFCGVILLCWIWDIFAIITRRFKVPVAIDLDEEE